jgi:formylglycine-generating enzyme required for sulfatase activity
MGKRFSIYRSRNHAPAAIALIVIGCAFAFQIISGTGQTKPGEMKPTPTPTAAPAKKSEAEQPTNTPPAGTKRVKPLDPKDDGAGFQLRIPLAQRRMAQAGAVVRNRLGMELAYAPAGSFMMGSENGGRDEQPAHQVTFSQGFYIGKFEVTQQQWQAVMGTNPSHFKGESLPVEQVSWDDAQAFIRRLNEQNDGYIYRLPSESEWEYACRAGTTADYAGELDSMAWFGDERAGRQTHPVGQKRPNAWGLYDMHGNVWEWCEDLYHEGYQGAPVDGSAWLTGGEQKRRALRGGSWLLIDPQLLRCAHRSRLAPDHRNKEIGFRVVALALV